MIAAVILVLVTVSLLAGLALMYYQSKAIEYPSGPATQISNVVMYCEDPTLKDVNYTTLARAVTATKAAWLQCAALTAYALNASKIDNLATVYIMLDTVADVQAYEPGSASYQTYLKHKNGSMSNIPLLVLKSSFLTEAVSTGEPIIHECLHALLDGGDYTHSTVAVWKANSSKFIGGKTVQELAEDQFKV